MTTLRTAAQQALEALDISLQMVLPKQQSDKARRAAYALRAALAEPVQEPCNKSCAPGYCYCEPVAWAGYDLEGMVEAFSRVIEAHHSSKHPFHNPIDMDAKMALRILRGFIPAMKAYAAPPQRKPLTNTEMDAALRRAGIVATFEALRCIGRAVEAAHGIKNQP